MSLSQSTKPRTQKARGIQLLAAHDPWLADYATLISDANALAKHFFWHDIPLFARPCPVRPRHGFVESRLVATLAQLQELWEETTKEDPKAEIILMPFINASASAVITEKSIAIGPGHDGATSGKNCLEIPLVGLKMQMFSKALDKGDSAYIEAVCGPDSTVRLVQVRGGPAVAGGGGNWIPKDIVVTKVLRAEGDLLSWEKDIVRAEEGTVVWSPGGTMLSHYAVHARLSGIPVVFDAQSPVVGNTLSATTTEDKSWDREAFRIGAREGLWLPIGEHWEAVRAIALACHHGAAWAGNSTMTRLLGRAAAVFVRLGYAAAIGEFRHKRSSGLNGKNRHYVYTVVLQPGALTKKYCRDRLPRALHAFMNDTWKTGYGGKKWGECLEACMRLEAAIRGVVGKEGRKGKGSIQKVLQEINKTINLAHNNGWWLNKFSSDVFLLNGLAEGSVSPTAQAAFGMWTLGKASVSAGTNVPKGWPDDSPYVPEAVKEEKKNKRSRKSEAVVPVPVPVPVEASPAEKQEPLQAFPHLPGVNEGEPGCSCPSCKKQEELANDEEDEEVAEQILNPQGLKEAVSSQRLQASLRHGTVLHMQCGVSGNYRRFDIDVTDTEAAKWNEALPSRKKAKSLWGSNTTYWVIAEDTIKELPSRIRDYAKWMLQGNGEAGG